HRRRRQEHPLRQGPQPAQSRQEAHLPGVELTLPPPAAAACESVRRPPSPLFSKGERVSRQQRGFTLIEFLIVVAIVGLMIAITLPSFGRMRRQAALKAA